MAIKASIADGNWNTAATWGSVVNTPSIHAGTNITIITSTYYTATFTAPNTTDACLGCIFMWVTSGVASAGGYIRVTLQENSAGWVDVVYADVDTVIGSSNRTITTPCFAKFSSGYVFTATTSGYYRFKFVRSGTYGSNPAFAADSGGSLISFLAVSNATGVPGSTDDAVIVGYNRTNDTTVTVDGTRSIGSGTSLTSTFTSRLWTLSFNVGVGGILTWDTSASATLTAYGNFAISSYGSIIIGTEASPYPSSYVGSLILSNPTLAFNTGGLFANYGTLCSFVGVEKSSTTLWRTTWVSGVGTAASPLVVTDAVDWSVGDEIIFAPNSNSATNYNETEYRFIITKNSSTSYVLSDTLGGSELALSYTHGEILNITRNVIIASDSSSRQGYFNNQSLVADAFVMQWARVNYFGHSSSAPSPLSLNLSSATGVYFKFNYNVVYNPLSYHIYCQSRIPLTMTGNILCSGTTTNNGGIFASSGNNKTFADCYGIDLPSSFTTAGPFQTYSGCKVFSCNKNAYSTRGGIEGGGYSVIFNNCEFHCIRLAAINSQKENCATFNNCLFGTKGYNGYDIWLPTDLPVTMTLYNCSFGSTTLVGNYLNSLGGTEIRFQKYNTTTNDNFWYTSYGIARSTGTGLTDTTVRTVDSLALRISPEESSEGFTWEFYIYQLANSIVNFFGYFMKNAAFGTDVVTVSLYLSGSTTADDTFTLADTTAWQACSLSKSYTGSENTLAVIKVNAKTTTSAAYLYCDDFFNAGNTLVTTDGVGGLDTWVNGKIVDIISPKTISASDIWTFSTSDLTTANTTGKKLKDSLTTAKFIALK